MHSVSLYVPNSFDCGSDTQKKNPTTKLFNLNSLTFKTEQSRATTKKWCYIGILLCAISFPKGQQDVSLQQVTKMPLHCYLLVLDTSEENPIKTYSSAKETQWVNTELVLCMLQLFGMIF